MVEASGRGNRGDGVMNRETELKSVITLVEEQAKDAGLWFIARTASEAYLQQELRKLHAEIEKCCETVPSPPLKGADQ